MYENKFFRSTNDIFMVVFGLIGLGFLLASALLFSFGWYDTTTMLAIVFLIIELPFIIVGVLLGTRHVKRSEQINELLKTGELALADVNEVDFVSYVHISGSMPKILVCSIDMDKKKYVFRSEFLKINPSSFIIGSKVPVYYDRNNMKNYYVNCNAIESDDIIFL